jgi:hypothetical protein
MHIAVYFFTLYAAVRCFYSSFPKCIISYAFRITDNQDVYPRRLFPLFTKRGLALCETNSELQAFQNEVGARYFLPPHSLQTGSGAPSDGYLGH